MHKRDVSDGSENDAKEIIDDIQNPLNITSPRFTNVDEKWLENWNKCVSLQEPLNISEETCRKDTEKAYDIRNDILEKRFGIPMVSIDLSQGDDFCSLQDYKGEKNMMEVAE